MASSSRQHAVDIDKLSTSTKEKLQMLPSLSGDRCIYSVPLRMRLSCEQYFEPQIVSIGPIHHGNEKLRVNEHLKERYLAEFCELTKVSLKVCYNCILKHERRLRNCYADVIELNSENFVKMVLVDSAFLLMMSVYNYRRSLLENTDLVFQNPRMMLEIRYDLLLLENQLPFFILEDLYELSKLQIVLGPKSVEEPSMTFLASNLLINLHPPKASELHPPSKPEHILDLYRSRFIRADWNPIRNGIETKLMPNTKKLYQAGVKIQVGCEKNMFDIIFSDGILKIPPLFIFDSTEVVFRNLLAYELCHCLKTRIFSDYFEMMRLLTLSSEDIELLLQNGIIINELPNAERVSTLFQNICTGNIVDFSGFLYTDVIKGLNEYYKHDWHKWKATLNEKYLKAPWAICSIFAAVLLLVLTIVQTVFTILQVVLPK